MDEEYRDKLRRAYEMEEKMADELMNLCGLDEPVTGLDPGPDALCRKMLRAIHEDTLRHQTLVKSLIEGNG